MFMQEPNIDRQPVLPATPSAAEPAFEKREQYEANMETKLRDLGAKIDQWADKAESFKRQAGVKLEELQAKKDETVKRLQVLKDAGVEAWTEMKPSLEQAVGEVYAAWEELKLGSSRAKCKFDEVSADQTKHS